jgi:hypothetical protein
MEMKIAGTCWILVVLSALSTFAIGIGIPGFHAIVWLRTGSWSEYLTWQFFVYAGLPFPQTSWAGLQRAIDWSLRQPFACTGSAASMAVGFIFALLAEGQERKIDKKTRVGNKRL